MEATSDLDAAETAAPVFTEQALDVRRGSGLVVGVVVGAIVAVSIATRSGIGLAVALVALLVGMAMSVGVKTSAGRWCLATLALLPWLVIRDSTWLAISIVATVLLVAALASAASATRQSMTNMLLAAVFRIDAVPAVEISESKANARAETQERFAAVLRGVLLAIPIVLGFGWLLASADDVFASIFTAPDANPSLPFGRIGLFIVLCPVFASIGTYAATKRTPGSKTPSAFAAKYLGPVESTIVLGAVSALFAVFVTIRLATLNRPLNEAAWRSEVRSGFFQLLWVAALTVLLVLAIHQMTGDRGLITRVRRLGWLAIALAAVIDCLALIRIAEYVERSFLTPLRFWSFGFGLWLLVLLGLAAVRLSNVRSETKWFTAIALASWVVFLFALGAINPDQRIAQHNFDNAPTAEDQWIAVKPLMWLSEDATEVIVENIEVLRPMPNDRYLRVQDHLCATDRGGGWREWHLSRTAAKDVVADLC